MMKVIGVGDDDEDGDDYMNVNDSSSFDGEGESEESEWGGWEKWSKVKVRGESMDETCKVIDQWGGFMVWR